MTGLKNIFFNGIVPASNSKRKESNNFSQSSKTVESNVSFQKRYDNYTEKEKIIIKAMKFIAIKLELPCFYTGVLFSEKQKPTLEHFLPYSQKKFAEKIGLKSINAPANMIMVLDDANNKRASIPLAEWYKIHPDYIENGQEALERIRQVNFPLEGIIGKNWADGVVKNLNQQLGYLAFRGNNSVKSQNKENNYFSQKNEKRILFGKKKDNDLFKELRRTALRKKLIDFYTGETFSMKRFPTVDHIIPQLRAKIGKLTGLENVHDIGNLVLTNAATNTAKGAIPLAEWYKMHPDYLENSKKALELYKKISTQRITGFVWADRLKQTLNKELGYPAFTGKSHLQSNQSQNLSYKS